MKRSLLLVSTVCLFSLGATAQNYAPAAWTFSKQRRVAQQDYSLKKWLLRTGTVKLLSV